ncbi:MAG: helix-turn-helix transcriptional regulator, partial [Clostridia bacterium]|nr:helix-turn-helix transcriptional regulator [Clostridia bacterium]
MELMIGEKLRKLRRDRDMTQEMLASAFGVSPQAISKWECGDGYPDITLLPMIANYFKVTIDELMGNDEIGQRED